MRIYPITSHRFHGVCVFVCAYLSALPPAGPQAFSPRRLLLVSTLTFCLINACRWSTLYWVLQNLAIVFVWWHPKQRAVKAFTIMASCREMRGEKCKHVHCLMHRRAVEWRARQCLIGTWYGVDSSTTMRLCLHLHGERTHHILMDHHPVVHPADKGIRATCSRAHQINNRQVCRMSLHSMIPIHGRY